MGTNSTPRGVAMPDRRLDHVECERARDSARALSTPSKDHAATPLRDEVAGEPAWAAAVALTAGRAVDSVGLGRCVGDGIAAADTPAGALAPPIGYGEPI